MLKIWYWCIPNFLPVQPMKGKLVVMVTVSSLACYTSGCVFARLVHGIASSFIFCVHYVYLPIAVLKCDLIVCDSVVNASFSWSLRTKILAAIAKKR